jgi:hypothetical protein
VCALLLCHPGPSVSLAVYQNSGAHWLFRCSAVPSLPNTGDLGVGAFLSAIEREAKRAGVRFPSPCSHAAA